jgi:competence protein ComEA
MVFTTAERRLLALLVLFLGLGYVLTGVRRCGGFGRADGDSTGVRIDSAAVAAVATIVDSVPAPAFLDSAMRCGAPDPYLDGYLDLNAADSLELLSLPGIGPAFASRLLAFRRTHGAFASVEDLLDVKGIGPKRLERLRAFVIVRPAPAR